MGKIKMSKTLSEIKRHNKSIGQHFFDRGNPRVLSKKGNYLVTRGLSGDKFVVYRYDPKTGHINFVDNPSGEYSWQPYNTKAEAIRYVNKLVKK